MEQNPENKKTNLKVSVLLATYNGGKYLKEQLDSIFKQDFSSFNLYVSDDGSSDDTMEILNSYVSVFPEKIHILNKRKHPENEKPENSACSNFLYLLKNVDSDLYFFCDQDDVWKEDHISMMLEKYNTLASAERNLPVLIYTDLSVVDSKLGIISTSDFDYAKRPANQHKNSYFFSTNIRGCATLINDSLKRMIFRNPEVLEKNLSKIEMHDVFATLIASFFGKKYFIKKSSLLYRQHGSNTCGIGKKRTFCETAKKGISFNRYKNSYKVLKNDLKKRQVYAAFFLEYFADLLGKKEKAVLTDFVNISNKIKIVRVLFLLKNQFLKYGLINNIWLFIVV